MTLVTMKASWFTGSPHSRHPGAERGQQVQRRGDILEGTRLLWWVNSIQWEIMANTRKSKETRNLLEMRDQSQFDTQEKVAIRMKPGSQEGNE